MSYTISVKKEVPVTALKCDIGVRYWEDGVVDGVEDENGDLMPLRVGDDWKPIIDLETGIIRDWPAGKTASVHYKVCDAGVYHLLNEEGETVLTKEGYVPSILSPGGSGYGDYVIMDIDENGKIDGWEVDLSDFDYDD